MKIIPDDHDMNPDEHGVIYFSGVSLGELCKKYT